MRLHGVWTWCWDGEEYTDTRVQETTIWGPREQRRPRPLALDLAGEVPSLGGKPGGREIDLRAKGRRWAELRVLELCRWGVGREAGHKVQSPSRWPGLQGALWGLSYRKEAEGQDEPPWGWKEKGGVSSMALGNVSTRLPDPMIRALRICLRMKTK